VEGGEWSLYSVWEGDLLVGLIHKYKLSEEYVVTVLSSISIYWNIHSVLYRVPGQELALQVDWARLSLCNQNISRIYNPTLASPPPSPCPHSWSTALSISTSHRLFQRPPPSKSHSVLAALSIAHTTASHDHWWSSVHLCVFRKWSIASHTTLTAISLS
jgi:hypothetical protein